MAIFKTENREGGMGIEMGIELGIGMGIGMGVGNGNGERGTGNGESLKWGTFKSGIL